MQPATRAYLKEFGAAMVAYVVVLFASIPLVNANLGSPIVYPLALAPMVPALFAVLAVVRATACVDELQRRMQLEALAFAFAGTAIVTFSYGMLGFVGVPQANWTLVWPIMGLLWLVGGVLAQRRYR
jgi:hypothetical protein